MKKNLFLLGLAVAAMTSCTNDEVVEVNQSTQKVIGFETFVNKTTRAIGNIGTPANSELTGLKKFYVFGFYKTGEGNSLVSHNVFQNIAVERQSDFSWKYEGVEQYWSNGTYYFAAYANDNTSGELTNVTFTKPDPTLTITDHIIEYDTSATPTTSNAKDLVATIKQEVGTENRGDDVDLSFTHLLSKIQLTIFNNNTQSLTVKITDVQISNINKMGTFTYPYTNSWSPTYNNWNTSESVNIIPIGERTLDVKDSETASVTSEEFYVLPQALTATGIKISFTAYYYQAGNPTPVITEPMVFYLNKDKGNTAYTSWEPNNFYHYIIGLPSTATPIEFGTIGVSGWENKSITLN